MNKEITMDKSLIGKTSYRLQKESEHRAAVLGMLFLFVLIISSGFGR